MNYEEIVNSNVSTSSPEEAAQNIQYANYADMPPSNFKEQKDAVKPIIDSAYFTPKTATKTVASYANTDPEMAKAVEPSVEHLSTAEEVLRFFSDGFNAAKENRKLSEAYRNKMDNNGNWANENDRYQAAISTDALKTYEDHKEKLGTFSKLLSGAVTAVSDIGLGAVDQLPLLLTTTAAGALTDTVVGATTGAIIPVPGGTVAGAATGATVGAVKGLVLGGTIVSFLDTYSITRGDLYRNLETLTNDKNEPIKLDETTKSQLSNGLAVATAAGSSTLGYIFMRKVPVLAKILSPKSLRTIVVDPAMSAVKQSLMNIGSMAALAGTSSSYAELLKIASEELGSTYKSLNENSGELEVLNAIVSFGNNIQKHLPRLEKAAEQGAATGAIIGTAVNVAGYKSTKSRFATEEDFRFQQARDVGETPKPKPSSGGQSLLPMTEGTLYPETKGAPNYPSGGLPATQIEWLQQSGVRAMQLHHALQSVQDLTNNSPMEKTAPSELTKIKKQMLDDAGLENIYLDVDEMEKTLSPEKNLKARETLDKTGTLAEQIDNPIKMSTVKFLDITKENPELFKFAKAQPEDIPLSKAERLFVDLQDNINKRNEILGSLSTDEAYVKDHPELLQNLQENQHIINSVLDEHYVGKSLTSSLADTVVANEQTYTPKNKSKSEKERAKFLNQESVPSPIKEVLPEKEAALYEDISKKSRDHVDQIIQYTADRELSKVRELQKEIAFEVQQEVESNKAQLDPNIKVVENFMLGNIINPDIISNNIAEDLLKSHSKKGYSPLAIDPALVPDRLSKWIDDPVLKKRRVFVKGGMAPERAAKLINANNASTLFNILAHSPTQKEAVAEGMEKSLAQIDKSINEHVTKNEKAIENAYNNLTHIHLQQLKYYKEKEWPTFKRAIKRIALPIPSIKVLRQKAVNAIRANQVKSLSPTLYDVAERKYNKKAITAVLNGDIYSAFDFTQKAALASELARASRLAILKSNRDIKRIAKLNRPSIQKLLESADDLFKDAFNEIADVFDLQGNKSIGAMHRGAFQKYVAEMIMRGEGNFGDIPDRLLDVRTPLKELTVDQLTFIADTLTQIVRQARLKNKLTEKWKKIVQTDTVNGIIESLELNITSHPKYGSKPTVNSQALDKAAIGRIFRTAEGLMSDIEHIALELDNYEVNGLWHQIIVQPLRGTGAYHAGAGQSAVIKHLAEITQSFQAGITAFGEKEFSDLAIDMVNAPEFKNLPLLNNGVMSKLQLMVMATHLGLEGNRDRLENFGAPISIISRVIERELREKHLDFIQKYIWDRFEQMKPIIEKVHIITRGEKPEFIESYSFEMFGKMYRGGYMRLFYDTGSDIIQTVREETRRADMLVGLVDGEYNPEFAADNLTRHDYLKTRIGSEKPVSLNVLTWAKAFEDAIYDIHMRIPVRESLTILQDPRVAKMIASTVGLEKYRVLTNSIMEGTSGSKINESTLYQDQQSLVNAFFSKKAGAFATTYLLYNTSTLLIQGASLSYTAEKMGGMNGIKHLSQTALTVASKPTLWGEFYKLAVEINPQIQTYVENINETTMGALSELFPEHRVFNKLDPILKAQEYINAKGFHYLGAADAGLKIVATLAAYRQFTEGDSPSWNKADLAKLSMEEVHNKAVAYAASLSNLTLTHTSKLDKVPFQKLPGLSLISKFLHDAKNALQNSVDVIKDINNSRLETQSSLGVLSDPLEQRALQFNSKADKAIFALGMSSVLTLYADLVRGRPTFMDTKGFKNDPSLAIVTYMAQAPLHTFSERFAQNIPAIRDLTYFIENPWVKTSTIPWTAALTDIGKGTRITISTLNDIFDLAHSHKISLSNTELKYLARTASYFTGGLPVNGTFRLLETLQSGLGGIDIAESTVDIMHNEIAKLKANIERYTNSDYSKPENKELAIDLNQLQEIIQKTESTINTTSQSGLDLLKHTIPEPDALQAQNWNYKNNMSPDDYTTMAFMESEYSPNAIPQLVRDKRTGKLTPASSAYGLYQFIRSTWENLVGKYGAENDITLEDIKDPVKQRQMIELQVTKEHIPTLKRNHIPVNFISIYTLHMNEPSRAIKLLKSKYNTPLFKIMGEDEAIKNGFRRNHTIKDYFNEIKNRKVIAETKWSTALDNPIDYLNEKFNLYKARADKIGHR